MTTKQSKTLLALLVFLAFANDSFSQSSFNISSMLPTSPDAVMLGRFGDIPVGPYTGSADISIPLYTYKDASSNFELPLVLQYHTSGVKVEDQAGSVGLGWLLDPGGAITQIVNGVDDSSDKIYSNDPTGYQNLIGTSVSAYTERPASCQSLWPCGNPSLGSDSYITMNSLLMGMGQPDIYSFNFAGISGKFYINPVTNQVVFLNKSQEISFVQTGSSNGPWTATLLDGKTFYFSAMEYSYTNIASSYSGRSWRLTKIDLNNGKTIQFNYKAGSYGSYTYNETYHDQIPFTTPGSGIVPNLSNVLNNPQYLKEIITDDVKIEFNIDSLRTDVSTQKINSIDVYSLVTNKKVKSFNFYYDYFPYTTSGSNYVGTGNTTSMNLLGQRLRLDSLTEIGYDINQNPFAKPPYKFYYDPTVLPLKTSFAKDHWGYYNGALGNQRLLPDLSFFYYAGYPDYQTIPTYFFNGAGYGAMFANNANRSADTTNVKAGTLTKIVYPTGGSTSISYQINRFGNASYPADFEIQNSTFNNSVQDYNLSTDVTSKKFTLLRTSTVRFTNYIAWPPTQQLTFEQLLPATITLYKLTGTGSNTQGTVLQMWQMVDNQSYRQQFANNNIQWQEDVTIPFDPAATAYQVVVSLPDDLGPQNFSTAAAVVASQFTYFNMPNIPSVFSYGGGLRVSRIDDYAASGVPSKSKIFKYVNQDGSTSGRLMSPLVNLYNRPARVLNGSCVGGDVDGAVSTQFVIYDGGMQDFWYISSESYLPYSSSAMGSIVGYDRVEEIEIDPVAGSNTGKQVHYYHNVPSQTMLNCPDDPDLLNGKELRKETTDSNGLTLETVDHQYSTITTNSFPGFKMLPVTYTNDDNAPCACEGMNWGGIEGGLAKYDVVTYPMNTAWWVETRAIRASYSTSGGVVIDTTILSYDQKGLMISSMSKDSEGKEILKQYFYPPDVNTSMASLMGSQGLNSSLIDEVTQVNGQEVSRIHSDYNYNKGLTTERIVRTDITKSYNGAAAFSDVTFDLYDSNKNLLQLTKDGVTHTFLWSYNNSLVTAHIVGANYNTVIGKISQAQIDAAVSDDNAMRDLFNTLRNNLPNAQIETYTYRPLVGMSSKTDVSGKTTYYEYDALGRLVVIRDYNGKVLKTYNYHYKNENYAGSH